MNIYKEKLVSGDLNLYYINKHKSVFNVEESIYPLDLFEDLVDKAQGWELECSCKIEKDEIHPIRFNLAHQKPNFNHYQAVQNFFDKVKLRTGVKLDDQLLRKFIGNDFDFDQVIQILVGVDLRREISDSRLKFWIVLSNYSEKVAVAVALSEQIQTEELRKLIFDNPIVIGFDFFLDGRSTVEVYPSISRENFYRVDTQMQLAKILSAPAFQLLDSCWSLIIGFSKANPENILYYRTYDPNNFISKLRNDLASRVHAYYQGQPVKGTIVGLREKELLAGLVENINLYYHIGLCS